MAFAITVPGNASDMVGVPGNNKYVIKTCTFTGSYAAGALTATQLGLEQIHMLIFKPIYLNLLLATTYNQV